MLFLLCRMFPYSSLGIIFCMVKLWIWKSPLLLLWKTNLLKLPQTGTLIKIQVWTMLWRHSSRKSYSSSRDPNQSLLIYPKNCDRFSYFFLFFIFNYRHLCMNVQFWINKSAIMTAFFTTLDQDATLLLVYELLKCTQNNRTFSLFQHNTFCGILLTVNPL